MMSSDMNHRPAHCRQIGLHIRLFQNDHSQR
jgi:hypothetical protein